MNNEILFPSEPSYMTPDQLDRLLTFCYQQGASDITIQSGERVFAEIEGCQIKVTQRTLTLQEVSDIIAYIYGPNATAMLFSGADIDTSYRIKINDDEQYRFRVNMTACAFEGYEGIQATLRTISSEPPSLDKMGLEPDLSEHLRIPQGIVVISGSTGSGKSTLLASIISSLAQEENSNLKILTYESPIEYVYDKVPKPSCIISQTEIPRYLPSFAAGVRNALRRKPGLILVGETRDKETVEAVVDAALTGHPVYTTLHSNGVADAMRRMVTIFPAAERDARLFDLLETIKVLVWQCLVPTKSGKRTALREYLLLTHDLRNELIEVKPTQLVSVFRDMIKKYGKTIAQSAQEKFDEGLIDESILNRFVRN